MKNKKILNLIVAVLLVALLTCTLSACLKIGLKEANLIKRLKDYGADVAYARSSPIISDWQSKGVSIKDIIVAQMPEDDEDVVDGSNLDGDEEDGEATTGTQILYVFYANDKESADWIEKKCKEFKADENNADQCASWNIYRYDNIVMCGDYQLLAVARQY